MLASTSPMAALRAEPMGSVPAACACWMAPAMRAAISYFSMELCIMPLYLTAVIVDLALARVHGVVVDAHGDDVSGSQAQDVGREVWIDRMAAARVRLHG